MEIEYGNGQTEYGPGVVIRLDGNEVATAIDAYLVAHGVVVDGPRTVRVNGELCTGGGQIYVDPGGFVITPEGKKVHGRGPGRQADGRARLEEALRALDAAAPFVTGAAVSIRDLASALLKHQLENGPLVVLSGGGGSGSCGTATGGSARPMQGTAGGGAGGGAGGYVNPDPGARGS